MATIGQIEAAKASRKQTNSGSGRLNASDFVKQADGSYVSKSTGAVSPYKGQPQKPVPVATTAQGTLPTTPIVPKSTTVNSQNIAPVAPIELPEAKPPTYGGVDGAIDGLVTQNRTAQEQAQKETPTSAQDNYLKAILEQGDIPASVDRTEQDIAKKQSDKFLADLEQEQLAVRRRVERLKTNNTGMLSSGIAAEEERLNRESFSKQADIAILQTAANRNYDTAAAIADRAVAMKLEQSKANLEALKLLDSREYGDIQAKKQREYDILDRNENTIAQLKLKVAQYAGSNAPSILAKLSALDTTKPGAYDEAVAIAGKYTEDPLDRAIKNAQLSKLNKETVEAPTIKSINGVDMQWNGSAWIPAKVAGADGSDINNPQVYQEKINQFNSLINTANEAVELKKGAGNSGIKRAFNKTFVGSSKETQLQALTDTLKTNLLTLKGDPNLKKFFGPQMSDNDTRLMLSASSPIDVKSMTPDQVESYIKEISGFLERKKQEISIDYSQRMASEYIDGVSGLMTAQSITNLYPDPKKK